MVESKHPEREEIFGYVWQELSQEKEIEVGEHLAVCRECVEFSREIFKTKIFWENWTAKSHGEIYWQKRIRDTLQTAMEVSKNQAIKLRLMNWIRDYKAKAAGALEVILEDTKEMSRVITGLPGTIFVHDALQFSYAAVVRGEKEGAEIKIISREKEGIQVITDTVNKKITVRIKETVRIPPLVILAPQEGEPLVAEPKKVLGTCFYAVLFENISKGEYALIFAPGKSKKEN